MLHDLSGENCHACGALEVTFGSAVLELSGASEGPGRWLVGQLTTRSNAGGAVWPVPGADYGDSHRFYHKSLKITSLRHFGRREKEREAPESARGEFV